VHPTGAGIRVDTSLEDGLDVSTDYDPMLAKIIAWGPDRDEARRRLVAALDNTAIFGFETNLTFLRLLLERPEVAAGELDTGLIARVFDELAFPEAAPRVFAEAALLMHTSAARAPPAGPTGPWARDDGWRLGEAAPSVFDLEAGELGERVRVWASPLRVAVGDGEAATASVTVDRGWATVSIGGLARSFPFAASIDAACTDASSTGGVWLSDGGEAIHVRERRASYGAAAASDSSPTLVSPLPGIVVLLHANDGDRVEVGDAVVAVEAMKMEHVLRASVAGTVKLGVAVGDQVARGGIVATIETDDA
jgi:acetyl-CoA/propionyl-CoA carboxylase, biotin carboxylase, biotin carboxyl carrier protein